MVVDGENTMTYEPPIQITIDKKTMEELDNLTKLEKTLPLEEYKVKVIEVDKKMMATYSELGEAFQNLSPVDKMKTAGSVFIFGSGACEAPHKISTLIEGCRIEQWQTVRTKGLAVAKTKLTKSFLLDPNQLLNTKSFLSNEAIIEGLNAGITKSQLIDSSPIVKTLNTPTPTELPKMNLNLSDSPEPSSTKVHTNTAIDLKNQPKLLGNVETLNFNDLKLEYDYEHSESNPSETKSLEEISDSCIESLSEIDSSSETISSQALSSATDKNAKTSSLPSEIDVQKSNTTDSAESVLDNNSPPNKK